MAQLIFYLFAGILLTAATMVVIVRNPIHAALFLVLSFFASAVIWLLLYAEFLAIALVLVYVGAVMVLFLFVVMLLDINIVALREGFVRYLPVGIVIAVMMITAMILIVRSDYFTSNQFTPLAAAQPAEHSNTQQLGLTLYTEYLYQFEIAGAILLVAIIAAISLSMGKTKISKKQRPELQVLANKKERLRVINIPTEKKADD